MIVKIQDFGGIMNVSVSQPNLAQALSIVSHAVSSRSTLTILENILITTEQDRICLAATNLELGLRYWIPAQIEQEGSITVPARMFTDLVNTMPADTVNLQLNEINQSVVAVCTFLATIIEIQKSIWNRTHTIHIEGFQEGEHEE